MDSAFQGHVSGERSGGLYLRPPKIVQKAKRSHENPGTEYVRVISGRRLNRHTRKFQIA
jgi:hypothetical protein